MQKSKIETVKVSKTQRNNQAIGMTVSLDADLVDISNLVTFSDEFLVIPETFTSSQEGFLVGKYNFGNEINKIGISKTSFSSFTKCSDRRGLATSIQGSSPFNQFEKFSNEKISSALSCNFVETKVSPLDFQAIYPYKCQKTSKSILTIILPTTGEGLEIIKVYGNPVVTSFGQVALNPGDEKMDMFLDVYNDAKNSGNFEVSPVGCCITSIGKEPSPSTTDCSSVNFVTSYSQSIEGYKVHRFMFSMFVDRIISKFGNCTFAVMQYGSVEVSQTIPFSTENLQTNNEAPQTPQITNECSPPFGKKILGIGGKIYCVTDCPSIDQFYDDQKFQCKPVNCKEKYDGLKDYYNASIALCQPVTKCIDWKEKYNEQTNQCDIKDVFKNSSTVEESVSLFRDADVILLEPFDCGDHGVVSMDKSRCICDSGSRITPYETNSSNAVVKSLSTSDTQFCVMDVTSLDLPPGFQDLSWILAVLKLPLWLQVLLLSVTFLFILMLKLTTAMCLPCCCIRRVNMRKEAHRKAYGTLSKKSLFKRCISFFISGDFSSSECVLDEDQSRQLMVDYINRQKWKKKRENVMRKTQQEDEESDHLTPLEMYSLHQRTCLDEIIQDKKQDERIEKQVEESEEDGSTGEYNDSNDSEDTQ